MGAMSQCRKWNVCLVSEITYLINEGEHEMKAALEDTIELAEALHNPGFLLGDDGEHLRVADDGGCVRGCVCVCQFVENRWADPSSRISGWASADESHLNR